MTNLDILTLISFSIAIFIIVFATLQRKKFSRFVSGKTLGEIERTVAGLERVVVVADKLENPNSSIAQAVEYNLRQGVKYLFLVSNSKSEKELKGYYLLFEALAEKVIAENPELKNLVAIQKLSYDWPDVPYIFYQYRLKPHADLQAVAYRGNQKGGGISAFYEKLSPSYATAIITALLTAAPDEIKADLSGMRNVKDINSAKEG